MLLSTAAATAEHSGLCVCGVVIFMSGGVQAPSKPSDRQKSAGALLRSVSHSASIQDLHLSNLSTILEVVVEP